MDINEDWKSKCGFPINYNSGQSSDDDPDKNDVVIMRTRHSEYLLEDGGDGAEADLLGTTPPRHLRRKRFKKPVFGFGSRTQHQKRQEIVSLQQNSSLDLLKSRKQRRMMDRDLKNDSYNSLPQSNGGQAVPTLVESCNRFMSLTSRLKCREDACAEDPEEQVELRNQPAPAEDETPASRVTFHAIFSTLINMGNTEKGCRRTISREEQVWQNELKDLIWLELQAKLAGRTLAQQDAYLCAQRKIVPTVVQNIRDYRFVNPNPCRARSRRLCVGNSHEDLTTNEDIKVENDTKANNDDEDLSFGCLSFNCKQCIEAIGKAMSEVGTLLDSFYNVHALYPSSKAMTADHPLIATQLFQNRIKAMCLWYNTALNMRLKILAVRRLLRTMKLKGRRRGITHLTSTESDLSRQSSECRPCTVRFNVSTTPTDSNNSDSSHSDQKDDDEAKSCSDEQASEKEGDEKQDGNEIREHGEEPESAREENEVETADGDEVDCTAVRKDQSEPVTPEIIISDSKYATSDTTASSESGYSTSMEGEVMMRRPKTEDVYDIGSLEELTRLRLLGKCAVSPYRTYHHEILKTQGVRRCMQFTNKMRNVLLHKVYLTLVKPDGENDKKTEPVAEGDPVEVFDDTREEEKTEGQDEEAKRTYELRRYGCWSEESLAMRLPSYRSHLLLLSSICMEAVHDYLAMRLEDRPINPSCLTVKQLIHELKEGLDIATAIRSAFARDIEVALAGHAAGHAVRNDLLLLVRSFDQTVETVFKQYLSYLTTMSEVEHMSRSCLQQEWSFTARLAKRVRCAALLAPPAFSEITCNQLNRLKSQFEEKFKELVKIEEAGGDSRRLVYALCREAQSIYASERDATLQAAHWARALCSRLARAPPPAYMALRADVFNSVMSLRDCVVEHTRQIVERSRVVKSSTISVEDARDFDAIAARVRELLLQAHKLGFELHKELYRFAQAPFQPCEDKHARQRPASLQPVRPKPVSRRKRPETMVIHESFNPMIHKELHRFVHESPRVGPRRSVTQSPPRAAAGRGRLLRAESIAEDNEANVFDDINHFGEGQTQTSIELILSGEKLPEEVEYRPTETRISEEEKQWAVRVARAVVEFARCWMQFVVERCDKGRGLRPRWASQGLEFLMLACDPCNTKHLSDKEFEELKNEMDSCISHVVGSRPAARAPECGHAEKPSGRRARPPHSPLPHVALSPSSREEVPPPPSPPVEPDPLLSFEGNEPTAHHTRVLEAIKELDCQRDDKLREMKAVGRVIDLVVTNYEPKLRQLKFKWQRGLKIGAGTFGKVYTVVNTESGQLLAMKEITIGVGDRRALQKAANELRVLEGVIHPHLVRYYGCELHREEMLLFMELCVEGSLETLVVNSGALAEPTVRRYTKQLLSAVIELHARSIAHRDIKSGNIFLTNEGHCLKLGDFGCAVKIRANTTAAGELQGCVGTQAYMAPEVFMKSSGHGRAADIWSLGCVVAEMAAGKRPFSEYDSNYQIMFVVGMGGRPHIPETLSEEGRQFCLSCLTHEPDQRPKAEQLSLHHFLMVKSDDDCHCQPAYLMT